LHPSLTRVLVAVRDLALHQEVLDFLGRDGRVDVVAATTEPQEVPALVEGSGVDAVVSCADLARPASRSGVGRRGGSGGRGPDVHVIGGELSIPLLRLAVDIGARGAYRWPEEREELADRLRSRWSRSPGSARGGGRLVAVVPTRGGAGGTFVSTQLAVSMAARDVSTVLVDGALAFSDLTPALGLPADPPPATIADLRPVMGELNAHHLAHVLRHHDAGFDALLAPVDSQSVDGDGPRLVRSVIKMLAGEFDVVIVHLARGLDEVGLAASALADVTLLVTTLDLFSLYGARRLIDRLTPAGERQDGLSRLRIVVNRAGRGGLSPGEVRQVLGAEPVIRIRVDPSVPRAQSVGEVLAARSTRAARDVDRMAGSLVAELGISAPSDAAS
jgi:Flp pilus assembly CpaE family ATPase